MDPLSQIKILNLLNKLETATEERAKALGVDAEKYQLETLEPILERVKEGLPKDPASQLKLFRESVGEEMWATIAVNPSLPVLVAQHMDSLKASVLERVKADISAELGGHMDTDDIDELFRLQFGM